MSLRFCDGPEVRTALDSGGAPPRAVLGWFSHHRDAPHAASSLAQVLPRVAQQQRLTLEGDLLGEGRLAQI